MRPEDEEGSAIPYFFPSVRFPAKMISKEQFEGAVAGLYRYNPDKFAEVVRSCPGVAAQIVELVLEGVNKFATHPDGSVDTMRCGFFLGRLLRETNDNIQIARIARWINDLDRLPMYKVEESQP